MDSLGGEYEVEAGYGATRDSYLRDNAIDTFFIIPPAHRRKVMFKFVSHIVGFKKEDREFTINPFSAHFVLIIYVPIF